MLSWFSVTPTKCAPLPLQPARLWRSLNICKYPTFMSIPGQKHVSVSQLPLNFWESHLQRRHVVYAWTHLGGGVCGGVWSGGGWLRAGVCTACRPAICHPGSGSPLLLLAPHIPRSLGTVCPGPPTIQPARFPSQHALPLSEQTNRLKPQPEARWPQELRFWLVLF